MKRAILGGILTAGAAFLTFAQPAEPLPKFEAADVHVSPKGTGPMGGVARSMPVRNGRYEIKNATMVDLIRFAYGFDNDKVLGGPSWLEMDRFDVVAKVPADSTPDLNKQMLQSLLQERFNLVAHKETKPMPAYALVVGKKPLMKEADGTEQTGCRPKSASGPGPGGPGPGGPGMIRLMMASRDGGEPQSFTLGPGGTIEYNCRNQSMEQFAANLQGMVGANLGTSPVHDETGLKGVWNFDLNYSIGFVFGPAGDEANRITIFSAVEKQLGLKLEERQIPTPVITVESANRVPSPNPPETAKVLPPIPVPTEFEVASVKPSDPGGRGGRFQTQPGGRFTAQGMNLRFLVARAFNTPTFNMFNSDAIVGLPGFADTDRYDIIAKAPTPEGSTAQVDMDAMAPMMLSLLKERFGLKYHTEERPVTAYTLVAAKPKLKKADPNARTSCKNDNAPPPAAPGSRVWTCRNMTMDQFVDRLQGMNQDLSWPVANATGLEGGWDFSFTFNQRMGMPAMAMGMGGRGGGGGGEGGPGSAMPTASDPTDSYTIFEALEKQLGLKLEKQKRPMPVVVIDHIEQKPTEN